MTPERKKAYRWLLYRAMLDIRSIQWTVHGWKRRLNPFRWSLLLQHSREKGALADWLHNLAIYSALEFERFDEDWFWKEHEAYHRRYPKAGFELYRVEFDRVIDEGTR